MHWRQLRRAFCGIVTRRQAYIINAASPPPMSHEALIRAHDRIRELEAENQLLRELADRGLLRWLADRLAAGVRRGVQDLDWPAITAHMAVVGVEFLRAPSLPGNDPYVHQQAKTPAESRPRRE